MKNEKTTDNSKTNVNNKTMEKTMTKEEKTNPVNPVKTHTTPQLSPEQQEWLNSVFVPNLRNQMRKSSQIE
jgi:hypothetical protein